MPFPLELRFGRVVRPVLETLPVEFLTKWCQAHPHEANMYAYPLRVTNGPLSILISPYRLLRVIAQSSFADPRSSLMAQHLLQALQRKSDSYRELV